MITIPKELKPKVGQKYFIHKTANGSFIIAPKAPDIYANIKSGQYQDANKVDPVRYNP